MSQNQSELVEKMLHDVNSKSASLKSAAALLRGASAGERRELLSLMAQQTQNLAQAIAALEKEWRDK